MVQPSSSSSYSGAASAATSHRKIGIAVDLSDESAYAVEWAVHNYLRPGDSVILLHVTPTSVLYGADWGSTDISPRYFRPEPELDAFESEWERNKKLEADFDVFTTKKANELARPLMENDLPFRVHIVKDHDLRERLCLEVERLGLSALVTGSRGFGASASSSSSSRKGSRGRLGTVSDYCVHHCVCPVIVVRAPDEKDGGAGAGAGDRSGMHPLVEEEEEEEAESCVVDN